MSQNDKLELLSKLFDFEKRGNNYMAKSDGAVITIYQNGNHQKKKKNKETSRIITREEFEKTRQYGLEKLKDPEIRAVFMRLFEK